MAPTKSLTAFLSSLDPKTGSDDPDVKNMSDEEIASSLSKVEKSGILNQGSLDISGATSKQDKEAQEALEAGYSPEKVAKGLFPKADPPSAKQKEAQTVAQKEAQIQAVQNSPWTQLSNALTKEYAQEETPVAAAVSGQNINQDEAGAANSALASLGLSSGSSAGSWLAAQQAAAQATAAPVSQAMAQEGAQYAAQEQPIENAINAYGQANALSEETAPEASWLNALASHVQSNLSYYGLVPSADVGPGGSLSGGVATALKEAGGYGGTAGAGTTPIQNVTPTAGGGTKASAGSALAGAASTGVIPQAGISPGA